MHPNSYIKKELRKKIMSRNANNDKVIFQVSIDINDNWKVKWANFTMEDVEFLQEMFTQWVDEGHIMNVSGFDEHLFVDETSGADPEWTD